MSDRITVTLPDGSQHDFPAGSTAADVAASIGKRLAKDALAAKADGEWIDMSTPLTSDTDAVASIWVDDRLVYTQSLHGDKKRRALLFRKTVGHQFEVVRLAPGKHEVRVRVQSEAESYDQSRAVTGALTSGGSLLHIVCGTPGEGLQVSLEKQTYQ